MEFLFIDEKGGFDWAKAFEINAQDNICITSTQFKDSILLPVSEVGEVADILHCGLLFYSSTSFQACALASLNWHFLNPERDIRGVSWKASMHVIVIRKGILPQLKINDYNSVHVQAADLAYQALVRGANVIHDPSILKFGNPQHANLAVTSGDEYKFIVRNIGRKNLITVSWWSFLKNSFVNSVERKIVEPLIPITLKGYQQVRKIDRYTAIIPTINRYDYLKKAIYSLLENVRPPAEIIIIDQTTVANRISGYYDEFSFAPVKVIYMDKAGQCTARNRAVQEASDEWLLLFDDDSEAWPEMITEHINLLEHSTADISTGVSLAPWKDRTHIGKALSFYRISSVMDTGNCFIRKKTIEDVGMFDLAFDRGSGADDNIGKRLYMKGSVIVFNPHAIRTHYKASTGGLRQHGAWWKNKGTLWGPLPLPTESYNFLTFYPRKDYLRLCAYRLLTSYRRSDAWQSLFNTILFPWKVFQSYRKALLLLRGE